jgi:hypothetical protein
VAACLHVAHHVLTHQLANHAVARSQLCRADARAWVGELVDQRVQEVLGAFPDDTDDIDTKPHWVLPVTQDRVAAVQRTKLDRTKGMEPFKGLWVRDGRQKRDDAAPLVSLNNWQAWREQLARPMRVLRGVLDQGLVLAGGSVKKAMCGIPFGDSDRERPWRAHAEHAAAHGLSAGRRVHVVTRPATHRCHALTELHPVALVFNILFPPEAKQHPPDRKANR